MKFTITGALGNISHRLVGKLASNGHQVTVVSHNSQKIKAIESLEAKAAIGSIEDIDFLISAFEGADAVYTMVPPNFQIPDYNEFTVKVSKNYFKAIQETGVRYVVNLSSMGSPLAGIEPLAGYQSLEQYIDKLEGVNIMHLRPGGFYTNFYGSIEMIKNGGFMGNNFDESVKMILTHPQDIADAAFEALDTLSFKGTHIRYIVSDIKSGSELTRILGDAIGKEDLKWMHFSDQQLLEGLVRNGFSKDAAQHYIVDMGVAIREGILDKHYEENRHEVFGRISFSEFAKEFAFVYGKTQEMAY